MIVQSTERQTWSQAVYHKALRERKEPALSTTGFVVWEGSSRINGEPIVVIATTTTNNRKTGDVIQTWILRQDCSPVDARNHDDEEATCGNCPLQGHRGCYVNTGQAPLAIWNKYCAGGYPQMTAEHLDAVRGKVLRIGSYGDPGATPVKAWMPLISACRAHVGYTHSPRAQWRPYCMASVETETQAQRAHAKGWRTFRARRPGSDSQLPNEILCPAERGITCEECRLCGGASKRAKSIVIDAHGPTSHRMLYLLNQYPPRGD